MKEIVLQEEFREVYFAALHLLRGVQAKHKGGLPYPRDSNAPKLNKASSLNHIRDPLKFHRIFLNEGALEFLGTCQLYRRDYQPRYEAT